MKRCARGAQGLVRAAAGLAVLALAAGAGSAAEPFPVGLGGDFTLTDHRGEARSSDEFRGRLMLVYFGYTACPHSCGMALNTISAALDALDRQADGVVPLFVTVDPEHDDPARLAAHLRNFHRAIVGLTGDPDAIAAVRDGYRAAARRIADAGAFERLVDHTTLIYLMGRHGELLSLLPPVLPPQRIAAIVRDHM